MIILQQKNTRLVNDETSRRNIDSNLGIYLTAAKVAQYRLVADNRREKEEAKKETAKKTSTQNLYLQQKRSEAFQKIPRLHEQYIFVSHQIIHVHQPI